MNQDNRFGLIQISEKEYRELMEKGQKYLDENGKHEQDPPDIGLLERMCDTTRALNECLRILSEISVILFGRTAIQEEEIKEGSAMKDAVTANMITAGLLLQELRELAGRIGV